tara:strand:+ start:1123 stop:1836 length:714 start_codon:yes stop_codon:yes gene_type:complete
MGKIEIYIAAPFGNYLKFKDFTSVTGTFTLNHRTGRLIQIVRTLRYSFSDKCWYNALGLRNPGILSGIKSHKNDEIMSIAAIESKDWRNLNSIIPNKIPLELNISCPNIDHFSDYVKNIDLYVPRNPIVKLSPHMKLKDIDELYDMGFRRFHSCNTFKTFKGARSGKFLKPYVNHQICYLKSKDANNYCIAGGGIENEDDILHYHKAGADAYSLGTVCFNPFKLLSLKKTLDNTFLY